ncbi:MAG TPA: DUF58 domain-containing protein [Candidatus Binataceae bacterium]|nr:DUF58 domain-containing protein [Candidatus Binataceae bacterium]
MLGLPEEFTPDFIARLEQLRIKTRREYAGLGKGTHLSPRRGSSLEFSDYRPYSTGDDFRYIDWGLYGRTDKLYIKLFKEEEDLLTYVFVDASASMNWPERDHKFASAVAIALALAYVALASGDRVMIRVVGGEGKRPAPVFVLGRHRIVELARSLSGIRPAGAADLAPTLAQEMVSIRRAGKVFLISDFLMNPAAANRALGLFSASNMDVTAIQILGGLELEGQGLNGDVEVVDAESGERVRVSIGNREREQYRQTLLRLTREIKVFCFRNGIRYALYTTDVGFHDFFLRAVADLGLAR